MPSNNIIEISNNLISLQFFYLRSLMYTYLEISDFGSVRNARPLTKPITKFLSFDNMNRDEQYQLKDVTCEQAVRASA